MMLPLPQYSKLLLTDMVNLMRKKLVEVIEPVKQLVVLVSFTSRLQKFRLSTAATVSN